MQPRFTGGWTPELDQARARTLAGTPLGRLWANLADLRALADAEEAQVGRLVERVAPAPTVRVPLLETDVHDLQGLSVVGDHVFDRHRSAGTLDGEGE
jgi:hypothetical protein